jgi:hypothetical protein
MTCSKHDLQIDMIVFMNTFDSDVLGFFDVMHHWVLLWWLNEVLVEEDQTILILEFRHNQ